MKSRTARRLAFEPLEQRRLLEVHWPLVDDFSFTDVVTEGEAGVLAAASDRVFVESVSVSPAPVSGLDIVFSQPMAIAPMIGDGSIRSAVSLISLADGAVDLGNDQFVYDDATRTLKWTTGNPLASGYYDLRMDGSLLQDTSGNTLEGGADGLAFNLPMYAAAQDIHADGLAIAVDNFSVPSLVDWNGDTLFDLVVGEKTDAGEGKIRVYLNGGTAREPTFSTFSYAQQGDADLGVTASGCLGVFPRVFDWDGDGDKDLILGLADGRMQVFPNVHTDNDPKFGDPEFVLVGESGSKAEIDVGLRATLDIVDWDNDGRYDLVVGALDGKVRLFLNEADAGPADFRGELILQDGASDLAAPNMRSSVAVADLNGDGRKDLVLGDTAGQLLFYPNLGTDVAPAFDGWTLIEAGGMPVDLPGIPRSRPFVGDFNADGRPDLLVGAQDGLVRLYEATIWQTPTAHPGEVGVAGEVYSFAFGVPELVWQNQAEPLDVTGDGSIVPFDVLWVINELNDPLYHNDVGKLQLPPPLDAPPPYLDVNGDGHCTPIDALLVINHLNAAATEGEGEAASGVFELVFGQVSHGISALGATAGLSGSAGATNRQAARGTGQIALDGPRGNGFVPLFKGGPQGVELNQAATLRSLLTTTRVNNDAASALWDLETILPDLAADVAHSHDLT